MTQEQADNDMMTQEQTIELLMGMIKQANLSDSDLKMPWQKTEMARFHSLYGHLVEAIRAVGGADRYNHWIESGE